MTSAIDIKRYRTRALTCDGASYCSRQVILKFFHVVNHFSRHARKNIHPVLFAILEQCFCDNYIDPPYCTINRDESQKLINKIQRDELKMK
jgi:hypothetical protein